jgi:heterodisulfide reductase subunit D
LISEGRVRLGQFPHLVTYHDPCDLGRSSGIYEPPRRIIEAIPGATLIEMAQNRENALCCGGGGDLEMVDRDLVSAVAARKIQMALDTGAEIIVTACPQCERTMSAGVRAQKKRVRVLDVTEMVWRAMESSK